MAEGHIGDKILKARAVGGAGGWGAEIDWILQYGPSLHLQSIGIVLSLGRKARRVFGNNSDAVRKVEAEILTRAVQAKRGVQLAASEGAVFPGGEHHHELSSPQDARGKPPAEGV